MASIKDLGPQLHPALTELAKRRKMALLNGAYLDGCSPIPRAVESARLKKAYQTLMPMSNAPWAALAVESKQDRLEVGGVRTGSEELDRLLWRQVWQANDLDSESKLGHQGILTNGRVVAFVWPNADGEPEVTIDGADQAIVLYSEGRHRAPFRQAALRTFVDDDDRENCTLYRADGIYKLREAREQRDADDRVQAGGKWWEMRQPPEDVAWPLPNPWKVVPGVEILTNRRLAPGPFPYARGEFQHCHGLLDRINLLTFLGLVVAVWMGFPLRGVIGEKITRRILVDDDGNQIIGADGRPKSVAEPPFDQKPDSVVQFEDPAAKTFEFKAADRGNLSIFDELAQFATVTTTPAHYFPTSTGLSNISADMIRALEGGMHARVDGIHKPFIGSGWEEVLRVGGLMLGHDVPRETEIVWIDKQSRSLAEMADAAGKLKELLPPTLIAEKYLGLTQEEIGRMRAEMAGAAFDQLLAAAVTDTNPVVDEEPEPGADAD